MFKIFGACYGLHNVTEIVRRKLEKNEKIIASNANFGDSWVGVKKTLVIVYGKSIFNATVAIVEENGTFIPTNVDSIPTSYPVGGIIGGSYGKADITKKLRELIVQTNSSLDICSFVANNQTFGDSWVGTKKSLVVIGSCTTLNNDSNQIYSIVFQEDSFVVIPIGHELVSIVFSENNNNQSIRVPYGSSVEFLVKNGSKALGLEKGKAMFSGYELDSRKNIQDYNITSGSTLSFAREVSSGTPTSASISRSATSLPSLSGQQIKHVVVLMMENRSFDSMLSNLYDNIGKKPMYIMGENQTPFIHFSGLKQSVLMPNGVMETFSMIENNDNFQAPSSGGPGEPHWPHTTAQMYLIPQGNQYDGLMYIFKNPSSAIYTNEPSMKGFLQDYAFLHFKPSHDEKARKDLLQSYMSVFSPSLTPVTHALAEKYAICDEWFASVPTQTWPNRLFFSYGTSFGVLQNDSETVGDKWNLWSTKNRIAAIEKKTFFEKIASLDQSFSWKLYYHQSTEIYNGFIPCMSQAFGLSSPQNQVQFEELALDASDPKRTLPSFSFIEPRYEPQIWNTNKKSAPLSHNDHHPFHYEKGFPWRPSMLEGEKLILDTYEALFGPKAKDPESTLLIVTYDEAGGCFDHVPPPLHKESTSQFPSPHTSYRWDRLGIRVPCLFVSPWILEKTILRRETNSQQAFDHTSVSRSVRARWNIQDPMSAREAIAPMFWHVLNSKQPRPRSEAEGLIKILRDKVNDPKYVPTERTWTHEEIDKLKKQTLPSLAEGLVAISTLDRLSTSITAARCLDNGLTPPDSPTPEDLVEIAQSFETLLSKKQQITLEMESNLQKNQSREDISKSFAERVNFKINHTRALHNQFFSNRSFNNAIELANTNVPSTTVINDLQSFAEKEPAFAMKCLAQLAPTSTLQQAVQRQSNFTPNETAKAITELKKEHQKLQATVLKTMMI